MSRLLAYATCFLSRPSLFSIQPRKKKVPWASHVLWSNGRDGCTRLLFRSFDIMSRDREKDREGEGDGDHINDDDFSRRFYPWIKTFTSMKVSFVGTWTMIACFELQKACSITFKPISEEKPNRSLLTVLFHHNLALEEEEVAKSNSMSAAIVG